MVPIVLARMQLRSHVIEELKITMPPPGLPSRQASPTSQPSKKSSLIGDVRRPIFESGLPTVSPGVPFSITKPVTPAKPAVRSVVAKTTKTSLSGAFVTNVLEPFRT